MSGSRSSSHAPGSRRAGGAEQLIADGRVRVNGRVAELGASADPAVDRIEVDGRALPRPSRATHLAVHKPPGFLSSAHDERGRRSVVSLVDAGEDRLWPAGRLDVESEGLMILTNDGDWANRVMHPRYGNEREYAALISPSPTRAMLRQLRDGVTLEDGPARLLAARFARPAAGGGSRAERGGRLARRPDRGGPQARGAAPLRRRRRPRRAPGADADRPASPDRTAIGPVEAPSTVRGRGAGGRPALMATTVAIDGPSGAGKSTVGHALAQRIDANFVDTGLMYRALTLAALERGIALDDGPALAALVAGCRIEVERASPDQTDRLETVLLDGRDVTLDVRAPRVDRAVSAVSRHPEVRDAMVGVQRAAARRGSVVMVGRDIGTVILPDATLKVYLTADPEVRAARRAAEMGRPERVDAYLEEIRRRDAADTGRAVAPLRVPDGALVLDTGELEWTSAWMPSRRRSSGSMRSWFFHPGSAIAGFLARLLFRARVEGVEHLPRAGPLHPGVEPLLQPRPADPGLGDRAPDRSHRPLHGQDRDAKLADHRLAGDAVRRLLRAPRRG